MPIRIPCRLNNNDKIRAMDKEWALIVHYAPKNITHIRFVSNQTKPNWMFMSVTKNDDPYIPCIYLNRTWAIRNDMNMISHVDPQNIICKSDYYAIIDCRFYLNDKDELHRVYRMWDCREVIVYTEEDIPMLMIEYPGYFLGT